MHPYYLLMGLTVLLGLLVCQRHKSRPRDLLFLCVICGTMIAMSMLRAETVGVDTSVYLEYLTSVKAEGPAFLQGPQSPYRLEPGFSLLCLLLTQLFTPHLAVGLLSALIITLRAVAIYRQSSSVWVSVFVYISFGMFGYAMCTLRQELAISVFLFALPAIKSRRLLPFLLIVLLAATFHKSLYAALPLYWLAQLPLTRKTLAVYGGGTLLLLIFSQPLLKFITTYVYQSYQPGSYFTQGRDLNTALIPIILAITGYLLQKPLLACNPHNLVPLNLCVYAALLFVLTIKLFIFQRFALILLPAALFLIPELLEALSPDAHNLQAPAQSKGPPQRQRASTAVIKRELRQARTWYHAGIGFMLFTGILYFTFLLNTNRLLLVPFLLASG